MQLSGKRIIVTGGSQGIGEAAVHKVDAAFENAIAALGGLDVLANMGAQENSHE